MNEPSFPSRKFLLDTCVIQDLSSSYLSGPISDFLSKLQKSGNKFSISDFAVFELLRGANKKNENSGLETLSTFESYKVESDVLVVAARLETLYREMKRESGISDGDKILAATSVLTNNPVITRDTSDFPIPFFRESYRELLTYRNNRQDKTTVLLILEPDQAFIAQKFNERQ